MPVHLYKYISSASLLKVSVLGLQGIVFSQTAKSKDTFK